MYSRQAQSESDGTHEVALRRRRSGRLGARRNLGIVGAVITALVGACGGDDQQADDAQLDLTCTSWQQPGETCEEALLRIRCPACESSRDVQISFGFDPDGYLQQYRVDTPDVDPEVLDAILADLRRPDIDIATENIPAPVWDQMNRRPRQGWDSVTIEFPTKPSCVPIITGKFRVRCR